MIAPSKNHAKKSLPNKGNASSRFTKAVLGIIAIGAAIVATVFMMRTGDGETKESAREPAARRAAKQSTAAVPKNQPAVPPKEEPPPEPQIQVKRYGRSSNVPTSNTNNIHYASKTGLKVTDADGNVRDVRVKPIFRSRADNMLWAAVRPGGMPSGLNALRSRMRFQTGSDEAFLQALRTDEIAIGRDDPPHVVHAKKMTKEIKQGIIAELDKGRSFDDIYAEICAETRKERMYERIAQDDMRRIAREGDAAAMRRYIEDMNPVMRELGLKELRLPSWAEEDETTGEAVGD